MKSVTAVVGSARKKGLTAIAMQRVLDELQTFGDARTELVSLSDLQPRGVPRLQDVLRAGRGALPAEGRPRPALREDDGVRRRGARVAVPRAYALKDLGVHRHAS